MKPEALGLSKKQKEGSLFYIVAGKTPQQTKYFSYLNTAKVYQKKIKAKRIIRSRYW